MDRCCAYLLFINMTSHPATTVLVSTFCSQRRTFRRDEFPLIVPPHNPQSSSGSNVNYTIVNANGILKSQYSSQRMLMLLRSASVHFKISSKVGHPSHVFIHSDLILSTEGTGHWLDLRLCHSNSPIKNNPFSKIGQCGIQVWQQKTNSCTHSMIMRSLLASLLDELLK